MRSLGFFLLVLGLVGLGIGFLNTQEGALEKIYRQSADRMANDNRQLEALSRLAATQGEHLQVETDYQQVDERRQQYREEKQERTLKMVMFLAGGGFLTVTGLILVAVGQASSRKSLPPSVPPRTR